MSQVPAEPIFNILRERRVREPQNGAKVYDLTDPRGPRLVGQAVKFFGLADRKNVPELSYQWLTEITIAANEIEQQQVENEAAQRKANPLPGDPALHLVVEYSCSAVGANTRILRKGLPDLQKAYSYIIVDEADNGLNSPMEVREVWIKECADPSSPDKLTPNSVRGKKLLSPGRTDDYVQWEAIAYRALTRS